jgi:exodeoxyribonuclease VII small subunit
MAKTARFEERLQRLEEIGQKMRDGDLDLEEAVRLFDEGIRLARGLELELSRVERKVHILMNDPTMPQEEPSLDLFADTEEGPNEE